MNKVCLIPQQHEPWPEAMKQDIVLQAFFDPSEEIAHRQGEWAYSFGHDQEFNPYLPMSKAHKWWNEGWEFSQSNCGG